ncbi:MAG: ArsR family transcriptional regulator, partial [Proteobacteria bacterium]|nr:ArsR family transcriptional regulator [Pseudomonadota bacterium]
AHIGLDPGRLRTEFMSGADGNLLADYTDDFSRQVKKLGPLGKAEGMDGKKVKFRLDAARKLIPYLRLVERERLRVPVKTKQAYTQFFESDEIHRLFDAVFGDRLAISQIMMLLGETPLPTTEIAQQLGLNPSEVSRHMMASSRHGLVRYDTASKCYTLA